MQLSNSRGDKAPTLTGAESLTGAPSSHPQPSGPNTTAGGLIPPYPTECLGAAWSGQAEGPPGRCGALPLNQPYSTAPSKEKQTKDSDGVSHSLATPRHHPSQGRDAVFPWEGAGMLTGITVLLTTRTHMWSVPTAKSTPCHLLFLTITVQLWSASQAKVYLCALSGWAKHAFILASYSSCINK